MELFYRNIKDGMEKDAAIREAKLEYIDRHSHLGAHPYYWAGYVPLGDMAPIQMESAFGAMLKYGVLGLGALLLIFWLSRKRIRMS